MKNIWIYTTKMLTDYADLYPKGKGLELEFGEQDLSSFDFKYMTVSAS